MKETKLPNELTSEELQAVGDKAESLAKSTGVSKVHPLVFINEETNERVIAYLREPNYATKLAVMDKMMSAGLFTAADELRQAILIKEESSPLTYGEQSECDEFKMGVTDHCITMLKRLQNRFKKK